MTTDLKAAVERAAEEAVNKISNSPTGYRSEKRVEIIVREFLPLCESLEIAREAQCRLLELDYICDRFNMDSDRDEIAEHRKELLAAFSAKSEGK